MMRDYELTTRAVRDVASACDWYERQKADLGNRLVDDVFATVRVIREHPQRFPVYKAGVRVTRCRRFPYRIYYEEMPNGCIRILAVYHTARDERQWADDDRE